MTKDSLTKYHQYNKKIKKKKKKKKKKKARERYEILSKEEKEKILPER